MAGLIGLTACGRWLSNERVEVEFTLGPQVQAEGVSDVSIIVGGDRLSWPAVPPGETVTARFLPEPEHDPRVTLLYTARSAQRSWTGPRQPGPGYRMRLTLLSPSLIRHQSCRLPCTLD